MSDWRGDCGGGFTSTRDDVNGVKYVVGSGVVSRNTHVVEEMMCVVCVYVTEGA